MAVKTTFVVQAFERKRGRLVPGQKEVAPSQNGALKKAEALAKRLPGAAALKILADDETGELSGIEILDRFGEIPDDFADRLAEG